MCWRAVPGGQCMSCRFLPAAAPAACPPRCSDTGNVGNLKPRPRAGGRLGRGHGPGPASPVRDGSREPGSGGTKSRRRWVAGRWEPAALPAGAAPRLGAFGAVALARSLLPAFPVPRTAAVRPVGGKVRLGPIAPAQTPRPPLPCPTATAAQRVPFPPLPAQPGRRGGSARGSGGPCQAPRQHGGSARAEAGRDRKG